MQASIVALLPKVYSCTNVFRGFESKELHRFVVSGDRTVLESEAYQVEVANISTTVLS